MDNQKKYQQKRKKKIYKKNYFIRLQRFASCFVFALVFVLGAFLGILQLCGIICLFFFTICILKANVNGHSKWLNVCMHRFGLWMNKNQC